MSTDRDPNAVLKDLKKSMDIPKDWDTLEDFIEWYSDAKMPLMTPWNSSVMYTDDATSICVFRQGKYQVELYIIKPDKILPHHAHPGMEVTLVFMAAQGMSWATDIGKNSDGKGNEAFALRLSKLKDGEYHGGTATEKGFVLLSFEKWPEEITPSSAALHWQGETAGPIHDNLIASKDPLVSVRPGFADITKSTL